jgi:hypothetical protein
MAQDPSLSFNNWNHMYNPKIPQQIQYPSTPWKFPSPPQIQYPTPWIQYPNQTITWPQGWISYPFHGGKFPIQTQPPVQQLPLPLPPNVLPSNPPLRPQLPIQTNPNLNNKAIQQIETPIFPTYCISPMECNIVQLISGRITNQATSLVIIEHVERYSPRETNLTCKQSKEHHIEQI